MSRNPFLQLGELMDGDSSSFQNPCNDLNDLNLPRRTIGFAARPLRVAIGELYDYKLSKKRPEGFPQDFRLRLRDLLPDYCPTAPNGFADQCETDNGLGFDLGLVGCDGMISDELGQFLVAEEGRETILPIPFSAVIKLRDGSVLTFEAEEGSCQQVIRIRESSGVILTEVVVDCDTGGNYTGINKDKLKEWANEIVVSQVSLKGGVRLKLLFAPEINGYKLAIIEPNGTIDFHFVKEDWGWPIEAMIEDGGLEELLQEFIVYVEILEDGTALKILNHPSKGFFLHFVEAVKGKSVMIKIGQSNNTLDDLIAELKKIIPVCVILGDGGSAKIINHPVRGPGLRIMETDGMIAIPDIVMKNIKYGQKDLKDPLKAKDAIESTVIASKKLVDGSTFRIISNNNTIILFCYHPKFWLIETSFKALDIGEFNSLVTAEGKPNISLVGMSQERAGINIRSLFDRIQTYDDCLRMVQKIKMFLGYNGDTDSRYPANWPAKNDLLALDRFGIYRYPLSVHEDETGDLERDLH